MQVTVCLDMRCNNVSLSGQIVAAHFQPAGQGATSHSTSMRCSPCSEADCMPSDCELPNVVPRALRVSSNSRAVQSLCAVHCHVVPRRPPPPCPSSICVALSLSRSSLSAAVRPLFQVPSASSRIGTRRISPGSGISYLLTQLAGIALY